MKAALKYFRLKADDRGLLRAAFRALIGAKLRLVFGSFERLRETWDRPMGPVHGRTFEAERVAWAVSAVSGRIPFVDNCLARAVATLSMLRRRGLPGELRIGVAREEGRAFEAHAWVEYEGKALMGGDEAGRFTRLRRSGRNAETIAG